MKKFLLGLSIGVRLKLAISILVSLVILLLGIILYIYQRDIIFEQAKQNSYATIEDLIRFTQNEIDASEDKVNYFGQVARTYLNSLGAYHKEPEEEISYRVIGQDGLEVKVPALYYGNTRIQGDTTIYPELHKMGIDFYIYYQYTPEGLVEVYSSHNQEAIGRQETFVFEPGFEGLWRLSSFQDSVIHFSHWEGSKWVSTVRLFTYDAQGAIDGAIVVGIQERNEDKLQRTFQTKKFYETGVCYQVSLDGLVTFHPTMPITLMDQDTAVKRINDHQQTELAYFALRDTSGVRKYYFYKYYPTNYNTVVVEIPEKEIFTSLYALRNGILLGIVVLVLVLVLIITFISNTITTRLDKAVAHARNISKGDLTSSIEIDSADELAALGEALNQMSTVLKETVSGIGSTIQTVNHTSTELFDTSKNIAEGANEQASSLEEISASMEEMTSAVILNTENAKKTTSYSDESATNIQNSSQVLHESVNYLTKIADQIALINDIAFQTNLLALNAAVEAARAGEHGRGFSVVAAEIKKLAERSRVAADEIGDVSKKGMAIAREAGAKLSEHVPMVQQTAELVRGITTSSIEQNAGIDQINNAIQGLNGITQQNTTEANNIAENIRKLSENSETLDQLIRFFKTEKK